MRKMVRWLMLCVYHQNVDIICCVIYVGSPACMSCHDVEAQRWGERATSSGDLIAYHRVVPAMPCTTAFASPVRRHWAGAEVQG